MNLNRYPTGKKSKKYIGGDYMSGTCYHNKILSRRHSKRKKEVISNTTIAEVEDIYIKQNQRCAYTDIYIWFDMNSPDGTITASIDRINSNNGYEKENMQVVHKDINMMKMDKTHEEFLQMCRDVVNYQESLKNAQ